MPEKVRAHVFISGLVQRVYFRSYTTQKAKELGVFGWVKNLSDGRVEAVIEGEKENVQKLIEWMRIGPPNSQVERVEVNWEETKGEFSKFAIKHF